MIFNSIEFFIFLIPVFILYWFPLKNNLKAQNWLLLLGSYFFYGWWDWRFLILILFSSLVDFFVGLKLRQEEDEHKRKLLVWLSLFVNLGLLGFFKYFNFFIESFTEAFTFFGNPIERERLSIILPVGISFYTFQTLSYTLDVYRKKLKASDDLLSFLTFVSFFPQLVAGPIERASHLLPQFYRLRVFNYDWAISGAKIFLWGFFKKVVIADNSAILVEGIFADYSNQTSFSLILGSIFFSFQIYGDFSGYSDMAIGLSRMFGFDLVANFKFPFLSKNINEFWNRWHISLSSWFRDYLYIPLGGNKLGKRRAIINVFIVFLVSGFWHGANWTFIIWGLIHGLVYLFYYINKDNNKADQFKFNLPYILQVILTFCIVSLAFVFFRSPSVADSLGYLKGIVSSNGSGSFYISSSKHLLMTAITLMGTSILMGYEFVASRKGLFEVRLGKVDLILVGLCILFLGAFKNHLDFIYFQF
ncbi:MBOAT family O-acyltransferase [Algoriphagus sp. D3-2-R+10]|uniref:MBOAT family O-acyltransferase n=1 Tax=Algoriphagus aurantiacus TaxID=3103948 RepID=UPI002B3FB504|nr:MBOAT family O-acyltransferase [Algoriphagus sp. D3-2-R+10]MEB2777536.1 MBOAT family O-acyltransferase [Algoriphagus sp. D3-2-R+10]